MRKTLIKRMGQIKQEFENDLATDIRPFHFATGVTTLIYQLGKPLRQLRKQYPKAEIRVSVNVTEETVAGLHDRRFDLGLISLPVPEENLKIIPALRRRADDCAAVEQESPGSSDGIDTSRPSWLGFRSCFIPGERCCEY